MTGEASVFIMFDHKENAHVTYEENTRGKILGESVAWNPSPVNIEGILLVKGLKHNLLNVSKLCIKGNSIVFDTMSRLVEHNESKSLVFKGSRVDNIFFLIGMVCQYMVLNV